MIVNKAITVQKIGFCDICQRDAMKATTSAILLSWAPAGFGSLPSGSSYFCDSWHLESGGKGGKGKKGRKGGGRKQGPKDNSHFLFPFPLGGSQQPAQNQADGVRTIKEGWKCRARKTPKGKTTEVRPVKKVDLCNMGDRRQSK